VQNQRPGTITGCSNRKTNPSRGQLCGVFRGSVAQDGFSPNEPKMPLPGVKMGKLPLCARQGPQFRSWRALAFKAPSRPPIVRSRVSGFLALFTGLRRAGSRRRRPFARYWTSRRASRRARATISSSPWGPFSMWSYQRAGTLTGLRPAR
jgi:hypothetical protein